MQTNVHRVITGGSQSPEMVFQPETGMHQRIILGRGVYLGPDMPQPVQVAKGGVLGHIGVVVPNKSALERGEIGEQGQNCKQCEGKKSLEPKRRFRLRNFRMSNGLPNTGTIGPTFCHGRTTGLQSLDPNSYPIVTKN